MICEPPMKLLGVCFFSGCFSSTIASPSNAAVAIAAVAPAPPYPTTTTSASSSQRSAMSTLPDGLVEVIMPWMGQGCPDVVKGLQCCPHERRRRGWLRRGGDDGPGAVGHRRGQGDPPRGARPLPRDIAYLGRGQLAAPPPRPPPTPPPPHP